MSILMEKQAKAGEQVGINEGNSVEERTSLQSVETNAINQHQEAVLVTTSISERVETEAKTIEATIQNIEEVSPLEPQEEQSLTVPNQEQAQSIILFEQEVSASSEVILIQKEIY